MSFVSYLPSRVSRKRSLTIVDALKWPEGRVNSGMRIWPPLSTGVDEVGRFLLNMATRTRIS